MTNKKAAERILEAKKRGDIEGFHYTEITDELSANAPQIAAAYLEALNLLRQVQELPSTIEFQRRANVAIMFYLSQQESEKE